jgi:cyclohexanecarboxyl-CoA dehydrogenase
MLMDLAPSREHEEYREYVRDFTAREIAPQSRSWDQADELPWDAIEAMADAGLLGVIGDPALGGRGRDYVSLGITIEELARGDVSAAGICWLQATLGAMLPGWGEETVRAVYGGEKLVALATSEENAGSDVSGMECTAVFDRDAYVLNGTKVHVSLVPGAHVLGVTAKTTVNGKDLGITMFRVDADTPGVRFAAQPQLGMRAHQLGKVVLDNVRVPAGAVMGDGGSGKRVMNLRFNVSRCLSPLAAIGAAQAVLDETIAFAREKVAFGRALATNQSVSFPLVEHATRLEAARLMAYRALRMNDLGIDAVREAAMAKWFGISSAVQAATDCLQLRGANGYLTEYPYEQKLRDVTGLQFTGGTMNVMKILLVRHLIGRDYAGLP